MEGKLKEVSRRGIIPYFIIDRLVVTVFMGIVTYCVVLRLQDDIVHKGYCSFLQSLRPKSENKRTREDILYTCAAFRIRLIQ